MKKLYGTFGTVAFSFCLAVSSAHAETLIPEDFENGPGCIENYNAAIFFVNDRGELEVGTGSIGPGPCLNSRDYGLCSTEVSGPFVLDVDMMVTGGWENRASVVYFWNGDQRFYEFQINNYEYPTFGETVLQLVAGEGPGSCHIVAEAIDDLPSGIWRHVTIEVQGERHRVFVDGSLKLEGFDSTYTAGKVGLGGGFNGYGHFDNLLVSGTPAEPCLEWTEANIGGIAPSPRGHHAMAFHPANGIVLFGGYNPDSGNLDDTWAWDGDAWVPVPVAGPPARAQHAMTYAPACGGIVLFGGGSDSSPSGHLNDMWVWDGSAWMEIVPAPGDPWPTARGAHAMILS